MTQLFKLTDENGLTSSDVRWSEGTEHTVPDKHDIRSLDWLSAYEDPLVGVLLNPCYDCFAQPLLWEADGDISLRDRGLRVACTRLRTLRRLPLPRVSTAQRVRFAILCVQQVYLGARWSLWAEDWLSGADRSQESAEITEEDAAATLEVTEWEMGVRSIRAAWIAVRAARAAAEGAEKSAALKAAAAATAAARAALSELPLAALAQQSLHEEA